MRWVGSAGEGNLGLGRAVNLAWRVILVTIHTYVCVQTALSIHYF